MVYLERGGGGGEGCEEGAAGWRLQLVGVSAAPCASEAGSCRQGSKVGAAAAVCRAAIACLAVPQAAHCACAPPEHHPLSCASSCYEMPIMLVHQATPAVLRATCAPGHTRSATSHMCTAKATQGQQQTRPLPHSHTQARQHTASAASAAAAAAHRVLAVSKYALPTSTVMPLTRSSSLVSMMYAMYQDSRFLSLASRSYFSMVRLSTPP